MQRFFALRRLFGYLKACQRLFDNDILADSGEVKFIIKTSLNIDAKDGSDARRLAGESSRAAYFEELCFG